MNLDIVIQARLGVYHNARLRGHWAGSRRTCWRFDQLTLLPVVSVHIASQFWICGLLFDGAGAALAFRAWRFWISASKIKKKDLITLKKNLKKYNYLVTKLCFLVSASD